MKQTDALKEVHAEALRRADEAWQFERSNVEDGRSDQRFYAGDQWDEAAKKSRGADRPMLVVNRLGTFVRQVTGDLRQNPPAMKVLPSGGPASKEKAEIFAGMIRSIEAKCDATAAYVKAANNCAQAGQGAFRVLTRYVSAASFDQELYIEPIADPFAVLIDPLARMLDKSDMEYGFVFEAYSKPAFKAKWPDASMDDFPILVNGKPCTYEWVTGEKVRVAEYWRRETTKAMLYLLEDGTVTPKPRKRDKVIREREVEQVRIVSYMLSGKEVLSGPNAWAGKYIPICFVPGEEITIEGSTKRKGMVRDAKDPQRLLNYARTTEAEVATLQPKAPFVLTVDQVNGFEDIWDSAGTRNHPYLIYKADAKLGPNQAPQRSAPPIASSGLEALSATAGQDLHEVTGIYPASLGAKSNETSGVAIRARQHEGDTGSNYIADNTRRAIAYCGRIMVDLIPMVYDGERIVRVLKESGEHEMETINGVRLDEKTGEPLPPIDLSEGEYDVMISSGPSYLTRQQEMAENMIEAGRVLPQIGQVAPDLFVKALNFPGGDEIATRLERTVPPAIKDDNAPPPPPNPKDLADARESMASANLKDAQAAKTLLEADTLAAQLGSMGAQLQQLTQAVMGLMQGGGAPPMGRGPGQPPVSSPAGPAPQEPMPPAGPMMPAPDSGLVELEPMEPS